MALLFISYVAFSEPRAEPLEQSDLNLTIEYWTLEIVLQLFKTSQSRQLRRRASEIAIGNFRATKI